MPHSTMQEEEDATMQQPPPSSPPIPSSSMAQVAPETLDNSSPDGPDMDDQVELERLFAADNMASENDEFSQSTPSAAFKRMPSDTIPSSSPPPMPSKIDAGSRFSDPDIMLAFYRRLFPFRILYQWLNHGIKPSADMGHRELAFTLRSLQGDVYLRYQSYSTGDLLKKDVLRQNPTRFEIGPVYNTNPRDRKALHKALKPVAKELCFDLDLTDYDDVRTCCKEANICLKCWQWATMAVKVVDTCLREDFGFQHIMWVYSGRRGVHGWVCDKRARDMNDEKRRAIAGYLGVVMGSGDKKVNVRRPLHPHLQRSLKILAPHFQKDILKDQDPWRTGTQTEKLLNFLSDKALSQALKKKWDSAPGRSSASKWTDIDAVASSGVSANLDEKALLAAKQDIVLEYTYPRLDIEVSKKLNHLLKSPFVVHPGTGRVCVPIPISVKPDGTLDWTALDEFNPLTVPNVIDILNEIDAWDRQNTSSQTESKDEAEPENAPDGSSSKKNSNNNNINPADKMQDYAKTGLKPYVDYFKSFVADLLKSESRASKRGRDEDDGAEAVKGPDAMEF